MMILPPPAERESERAHALMLLLACDDVSQARKGSSYAKEAE
jgi:hypothetical protein